MFTSLFLNNQIISPCMSAFGMGDYKHIYVRFPSHLCCFGCSHIFEKIVKKEIPSHKVLTCYRITTKQCTHLLNRRFTKTTLYMHSWVSEQCWFEQPCSELWFQLSVTAFVVMLCLQDTNPLSKGHTLVVPKIKWVCLLASQSIFSSITMCLALVMASMCVYVCGWLFFNYCTDMQRWTNFRMT